MPLSLKPIFRGWPNFSMAWQIGRQVFANIIDTMGRDIFIEFKADPFFNLFRQMIAQQAKKRRLCNNQ
jgi:hypothetical protein